MACRLGATVADALYMATVYLGLSQFLMYEGVKVFLWLFGCFVLIYTGIETLIKTTSKNDELIPARKLETPLQSFSSGFLISIANPLTVLFWLGIYGSILAKTISVYEPSQIFIYSSAIFLGIIAWDLFMATVSSSAKLFMKERTKNGISIVSALCLIGFGIYFGYHGFEMLF